MIVVMEDVATEEQIALVMGGLVRLNYQVHCSRGSNCTLLGAVGEYSGGGDELRTMGGVKEIVYISSTYKLASRHFRPQGTKINVRGVVIGGSEAVVMAGPCAVESLDQINRIAESVSSSGARVLRGGAFKPRSSPYSFQGLGEIGLRYLRQAADRYGLLVVSEIMEPCQIPLFMSQVDILQVGARNMQNFNLLRELGRIGKPVLLKRGLSATLEETLLAAEYIMSGGNHEVILCERGIRTFDTASRSTLDLSAIPALKSLSHLPVIVDPSHATGKPDRAMIMAQAAVAAGADGILIEVHDQPGAALCDGAQAVLPGEFDKLMARLRLIAMAVDRSIAEPFYSRNHSIGSPRQLEIVAA
jgi:3-deoxy-7-phosphoheptulonate synthase